jgi:hypothetical protein
VTRGAPWLQPVAINGKSTERKTGENRPNPLRPVATRCPRNGKEGVDGSSPSEGSYESPANKGLFPLAALHFVQRARVWNSFWNSQTKKASILLSSQASRRLGTASSWLRTAPSSQVPSRAGLTRHSRAHTDFCRSVHSAVAAERRCEAGSLVKPTNQPYVEPLRDRRVANSVRAEPRYAMGSGHDAKCPRDGL